MDNVQNVPLQRVPLFIASDATKSHAAQCPVGFGESKFKVDSDEPSQGSDGGLGDLSVSQTVAD